MVNTGHPSQGCMRCRTQKIRCDLTKPSCTRCTRRNFPCDYVTGRRGFKSMNSWARICVNARIETIKSKRHDLEHASFSHNVHSNSTDSPHAPPLIYTLASRSYGTSIPHPDAYQDLACVLHWYTCSETTPNAFGAIHVQQMQSWWNMAHTSAIMYDALAVFSLHKRRSHTAYNPLHDIEYYTQKGRLIRKIGAQMSRSGIDTGQKIASIIAGGFLAACAMHEKQFAVVRGYLHALNDSGLYREYSSEQWLGFIYLDRHLALVREEPMILGFDIPQNYAWPGIEHVPQAIIGAAKKCAHASPLSSVMDAARWDELWRRIHLLFLTQPLLASTLSEAAFGQTYELDVHMRQIYSELCGEVRGRAVHDGRVEKDKLGKCSKGLKGSIKVRAEKSMLLLLALQQFVWILSASHAPVQEVVRRLYEDKTCELLHGLFPLCDEDRAWKNVCSWKRGSGRREALLGETREENVREDDGREDGMGLVMLLWCLYIVSASLGARDEAGIVICSARKVLCGLRMFHQVWTMEDLRTRFAICGLPGVSWSADGNDQEDEGMGRLGLPLGPFWAQISGCKDESVESEKCLGWSYKYAQAR